MAVNLFPSNGISHNILHFLNEDVFEYNLQALWSFPCVSGQIIKVSEYLQRHGQAAYEHEHCCCFGKQRTLCMII